MNQISLDKAPAVEIRNITKRFGKFTALDDVSFDIPRKSLFGMLGPNGAGKTTLFSIAAGFVQPNEGSVTILGVPVSNISRLRGRLSMLPQDAAFQSGIPIIEQLALFGELSGMSRANATDAGMEALTMVGLQGWAKRSAKVLSHGMAKRVALCQAFLGNPEVIFLDEPTAGLDPENARKIRELIRSLTRDSTVVLSSHNLKEIQEICDHACIIDRGQVKACGSMDSLTSAGKIFRITLPGGLPPALEQALAHHAHIAKVEPTGPDGFNLHLNVQQDQLDARDLMKFLYLTFLDADVYPTGIQEGGSLESIFLQITGGVYDGGSST